MQAIRYEARNHNISLWQAMCYIIEHKLLTAWAVNALQGFYDLIKGMRAEVQDTALSDLLDIVIKCSDLIAHYKKDTSGKAEDRLENLDGLITAAQEFEQRGLLQEQAASEEDLESLPALDPLAEFLSHAALEAGEDQAETYEDSLQLMTLHAAKYYYYPGWHEPGPAMELLINKKAWDKLPHNLQKLIEVTAAANNVWMHAEFDLRNQKALAELKKHRGQEEILPFPDDVVDEFRRLTGEVLNEQAAEDPVFKKIYGNYRAFMQQNRAWDTLSDSAYWAMIRRQESKNAVIILSPGGPIRNPPQQILQALAGMSLIGVQACNEVDVVYFPLPEGKLWQYRITTQDMDIQKQYVKVVSSAASRTVEVARNPIVSLEFLG